MDLTLDKELEEFQQVFSRFCQEEIAPVAEQVEANGVNGTILEKLGKAGYLGLLHPESQGGQGAIGGL